MNKPKRPNTHILQTISEKFFEGQVPNEWICDKPTKDYGIDYKVEIAIDKQMTGLNFSVQLKSTQKSKNSDHCNATLKQSTLNYYRARLEPTMLICYLNQDQEAFWVWLDDLNIDLSENKHTHSIQIPKINALSK